MEVNYMNQAEIEASQLGTFLAMLGDENFVGTDHISYEGPIEIQQNDVIPEDELYKVALGFSPADVSSEEHQPLPKIALEMINDIIGDNPEIMMEMGSGTAQVPQNDQEFAPIQGIDAHFGYPQPELHQMVPVKDPSVMLSSAVPQPQPTTIDDSQLMEHSSPQMLSETPSESMSVDASEATEECVPDDPPKKEGDNEEERGQMTQNPKAGEPPALPDCKELLIRIRYRSAEVVRKNVTNPSGCLVYYSKPSDLQMPPERLPDGITFPSPMKYKNEMTDSQYRFTDQVLKAIEKGLLLQCDEYGNVYATRHCRSKIFWYSTEKGPIAEAQNSSQVPNLTFQKLERNQPPVMVFDNLLFQRKLLHYVVHKPTFQNEAGKKKLENKHCIPISPAIFFTFAQSWNPLNSPLNSCLVSMVVNPLRARLQRQWGNEDRHESYDLSNYHPQISSQFEASGHS